MPDMQKLKDNKEKIIAIIQSQGPNFPARIARATGIPPLFASAFLAELVSEKRLKLSNLKVGSSPLYFIEGQEQDLENFADNLNFKEREAFELIKSSQVLQDETQEPAIRVALRSLKDFAHMVNVRLNGEVKTFWKFHTLKDQETKQFIQKIISSKQAPSQKPKQKTQEAQQSSPTISSKQTLKKPISTQEPINTDQSSTLTVPQKPKKSPAKINPPSEFANSIKDYLSAKDIEILETLSEKKKEFISKIRTNETFGKQEFYLIAKDKKKITTNDLTIALQNSQTQKMPALFISPGELDKRAQEHLKEWRNLIKFEKLSL